MLVWETPHSLSSLSNPHVSQHCFLDSILSLEISIVRISLVVWQISEKRCECIIRFNIVFFRLSDCMVGNLGDFCCFCCWVCSTLIMVNWIYILSSVYCFQGAGRAMSSLQHDFFLLGFTLARSQQPDARACNRETKGNNYFKSQASPGKHLLQICA